MARGRVAKVSLSSLVHDRGASSGGHAKAALRPHTRTSLVCSKRCTDVAALGGANVLLDFAPVPQNEIKGALHSAAKITI